VLFITKLNCLARSVIDLQNIVKFLEDKNVDLKVIQFGRRAILSFKDKKVIFKEYEKGKSVAWLSKFFHVARNTIYRAIKDVAKKK